MASTRVRTTIKDEGGHFARQTHAYAEYRVFSQLVAAGSQGDVTVALTRLEGDGLEPQVRCEIAVNVRAREVARVRAVGPHPHAAIDQAAALVGEAVRGLAAGRVAASE